MADTLPEGTDHIVTGNADLTSGSAKGGTGDTAASDGGRGQSSAPGDLAAQFGDRARDYVEQGKERATGALDEIARLIADNAKQIDGLVGTSYGDYARRAADYVSGAADGLREREVEELIDDARDFIRRAPGIALSAGAVAGFALARVIKSGSETLAENARTLDAAAPTDRR